MLAYSTISQLGYMFLAVGSGAYVAAIFHMITHAFFKALLFLGSGSVIHGMHDEQDMRRDGRAAQAACRSPRSPSSSAGWPSPACPPFAGFWSKDEILAYAFDKSPALWAVGLVTALLTAFYMSRQVFLIFFGEARWNDRAVAEDDRASEAAAQRRSHPHESPWTMTVPLVVLSAFAVVGGLINLPFSKRPARPRALARARRRTAPRPTSACRAASRSCWP